MPKASPLAWSLVCSKAEHPELQGSRGAVLFS